MEDILNSDISVLKGVGKKIRDSYALLNLETLYDLVMYPPKGYEDRSELVCVGKQMPGGPFTNTVVQITGKSFFGQKLKNIKIDAEDVYSGVRAHLYGFNRAFLSNMIQVGKYYRLYANQIFQNMKFGFCFSQFELHETDFFFSEFKGEGFVPVYAVAGTLTQKIIRRDIQNALEIINHIDNSLPERFYSKFKLINTDTAVRFMHNPSDQNEIIQSKRTLGFTEVFYMQFMAIRSHELGVKKNRNRKRRELVAPFIDSLNFTLTDDQKKVLTEITGDLDKEKPMNRLLQGDVGSGKTVVALISALYEIEKGHQVAFMAPTELLARQHEKKTKKLLEPLGVSIAYLDGQTGKKERKSVLSDILNGNVSLILGTHALFSNDVVYHNLSYVIIDEQHRFGVKQRTSLMSKADNPDVLFMTATPIPRTLALTIYGNLNVSTIKTMPLCRKEIKTCIISPEKLEGMYMFIRDEFEKGHKAYFVYPRIEENEEDDVKSVEQMFRQLASKYSKYKGELIHSRLADDEKIRILNQFSDGDLSFLVSTSVVEVGLDVPAATCMVIENAEMFGLSALHQLRGMVGRSELESWCFLVYGNRITEDAKTRLLSLVRTSDGFKIAEDDLKLRGPGEMSGLRQSGFTNLKYADLEQSLNMFEVARDEVNDILKNDPGLISMDNSVIRKNLHAYMSFSS